MSSAENITSHDQLKWRRRASYLGRFTLWHNGRRATQLGRFPLCGTIAATTQLDRFTLWHNSRRDKQRGFIDACTRTSTHFTTTVTNHAEKYEGLIQSIILPTVFNALEDTTNTDR